MGWAFIQSDSSWDDAGDSTPVSAPSTASTRRRRLPLAGDQADSIALSACKFSDTDIRAECGIADDEPDVTRKTWKMKFVKCWRMYRDAHFPDIDRKSTRLNSSHVKISYAVFCLKKKKKKTNKTNIIKH